MKKTTFDLTASLDRIRRAVSVNVSHRSVVMAGEFTEAIKRSFDPLFPEVVVFEGLEKNSALPVTIAYAGTHAEMQEYWTGAVLASGWRKHSLGRQFYLHIPSILRRTFPECNALWIEHNSFTHPKAGFQIPEWVDMEIDIAWPMDKLLGNQRAEIQRRISKFGLAYEISKDRREFDEFYHKMYLPYMKQRQAGDAAVSSYAALTEIFSRGELILVKDGDNVVCGGLYEIANGRVRCHKMGIKDGDWEYVREGVIGACYYFLITEMKKRGMRKISLGEIRPLLNDGVTKFKVSLRAQLAVTQHHPFVSMVLFRYAPGIESYLTNNPFICHDEKESAFRAVFFRPEDRPNEEFNDMVLDSICHGLIDSHIYVFSDLNERSNYFFCVKPAYPVFNHTVPVTKVKAQKVSWVKALQNSIAGG